MQSREVIGENWKATEQKKRDLECLAEQQRKLQNFAKDQKISLAAEVVDCRTYNEFAQNWQNVVTQLEGRQSNRCCKFSNRYGKFAQHAQTFMRNIDPLLGIVESFCAPYGGLAIGTISLFFVVANNKMAIQDYISSVMMGVKDRLPGFEVYKRIYLPDSPQGLLLHSKILEAYKEFVQFTIKATWYYLKPGYYRWMIAVFNPDKFKEQGGKVQDCVLSVRLKCEELLSERIDHLDTNVKDLKTNVEDLKTDIKYLEGSAESNNFGWFRQRLNLPTWTPESQTARFEDYKNAFWRDQRDGGDLISMDDHQIQRIKKDSDIYRAWDKEGECLILSLVGLNNPQVADGRRHCWASPFAWSVCEDLRQKNATYSFHFVLETDESLDAIFSVVILQLLMIKRPTSERMNSMKADLLAYQQCRNKQSPENGNIQRKLLQRVVENVFKLFDDNETVYIVLDRIDNCEMEDQKEMLNLLVHIIDISSCTVKILIIKKKLETAGKNIRYGKIEELRQVFPNGEFYW